MVGGSGRVVSLEALPTTEKTTSVGCVPSSVHLRRLCSDCWFLADACFPPFHSPRQLADVLRSSRYRSRSNTSLVSPETVSSLSGLTRETPPDCGVIGGGNSLSADCADISAEGTPPVAKSWLSSRCLRREGAAIGRRCGFDVLFLSVHLL